MLTRTLPYFSLLAATLTSPAIAQHDVQRNAVQQIAQGNHDEAAKTLSGKKKPNSGEAETLFVEMMSLLKQDKIEAAQAKAKAALGAGLPAERFAAGPRELLAKLPTLKEIEAITLVHGPMVGSVTDRAASFWLRTRMPAEVSIVIGDRRASARTSADSDFTAVVRMEGLRPNTSYGYQVLIDGQLAKTESTRFKTFASSEKPQPFAVGFGGGAGFIPEWERMWDNITKYKPTAFLMLGDNVYIDQPEHSLAQHYCYYRRQSRPEWRRFTASTAIYSIWDDHDFGTNDCVPGPEIEKPAWKRKVWEIYRQNWVNPAYGGGEKQPGCWYDFMIADVHFIMLDGRYYRNRVGGSMLGPVQKAWLKKTLKASTGTFKVLASPVPFSPKIKPGSKDPWDGFPDERAEIFSWIAESRIAGVFLIAADRHRTDLRTIPNPGSYTLYEFESSRLTNRHTHPVVKTEGLIWGYNKTCSFGLMKFDTSKDDPEVTFELIDIDGNTHQTHTLKQSALRSE
ncbi:MAG: alkaline phosphatase D family protein [Roseibacillus sp.]